jgi:hypothetical protein
MTVDTNFKIGTGDGLKGENTLTVPSGRITCGIL